MIAFSIWSLHVYWYGIYYFLSFVFAYGFFTFLLKKKIFLSKYPDFHKFLASSLEDIFLLGLVGVILWGRIGYVVIYDLAYYLHHPLEIFAFWKWGMSFIGGILWTVLVYLVFFLKKKLTLKNIFLFFDVLLVPVVFGIMLGRIGNYLNQELYGIIVPSGFWNMGYVWFSIFNDLNIFHVYPQVDNFLRVNTNFLASFFEGFLPLCTFLIIVSHWFKGKISIGQISVIFLMWYSWVRFFLEYVRFDSQFEYVWVFTKSQWFFLSFFVIGIVLMIWRKKRLSQ